MSRYLRVSAYRSTTRRRELRAVIDRAGAWLTVWQWTVGARWTP